MQVEATCFGKLHDQGLHLIDLVSYYLGGLPDRIGRVVVENEPARISSRRPLPADWRIDHHHPGPLATEIEASWENGDTFAIRCGPFSSDGWLEKQLTFQVGNQCARFRTDGAVLQIDDRMQEEVAGVLGDYLRATSNVYRQFHQWLMEGGNVPELPSLEEQIEQLDWCERALGQSDRERFEIPFWMKSTRSNLPILVVIPLSDHRGVAELCVRSWTETQTADPESFQLVLISNQETESLGHSLRQFLRPHDIVVDTGLPQAEMGQGDMEEYVRGIESSESEWIFLTEPHCEVPADTVSELIRFFESSESAGFCTGCIDKIESPWGRMEALYSEEGFEAWREPGNWSKMIMRGFGIRRTAYEGAGGFRLRYGRFSEWLLAADLHKHGYYLDYAPGVRVIHHYTPDKAYLDEAIEEFVVGQARYLAEVPEEERLPYFHSPSIELPLSKDLCRLFCELDRQARIIGMRRPRSFRLPSVTRLRIQREWNALIVRVFARWASGFAYPFFKRYYECQNTLCLLIHLTDSSSKREYSSLMKGNRFAAEARGFEAVSEVNQLERWSGIQFRWTKPNFAIRLEYEPGDRVSVQLDVLTGILEIDSRGVIALLDIRGANPIFPRAQKYESENETKLIFDLPALEKPFHGWVGFACEQANAPGDERSLGLPLRSASLETR